jgi:dephospho-CoA kinase
VKLLGVTGGVGMGKSTCGGLLLQRGVKVADTDTIARELASPDQAAFREIVERFGTSIVSPSGELDRSQVARLVFADEGARSDLEAILHPRIRAAWEAAARDWQAAGCACAAVIIPLLFDTGAEAQFDAVLCVACSERSQWRRLRDRGWSDGEIQRRLDAQLPTDEKIARSDFMVWSDTTVDAHAEQLDLVLKEMAGVR